MTKDNYDYLLIIRDACLSHFRIPLNEFINYKSRKSNLVICRQTIFALAYELTGLTTVAIGETFNKDHATITHSCKQVKNRNEIYSEFRLMYTRIRFDVMNQFFALEIKAKNERELINTNEEQFNIYL
jgi:chromosomal replication initiation ATPase DnaA